MANQPESSGGKTKNITLSAVLGWVLGVIFLIMGVTNLGNSIVSGILFILAALLMLPPVNALLRDKAQVSLSKGLRIAIVLVLMIVGFSLVGSGAAEKAETKVTAEASSPAPVREVIKVTAYRLSEDYKANEVAADAKYKGNLVEVSGIVDSIGKDILDTPYVTLTTSEYSIVGVQCMFGKSELGKLASLSKGQSVTLKGEVSGKLMNVIVRGCSIAE